MEGDKEARERKTESKRRLKVMSFRGAPLCRFHDGLRFQSSINSPQEFFNSRPPAKKVKMHMHLFGNLPNACAKRAKPQSLPNTGSQSQPCAEDFILRVKPPADNARKAGGGGEGIFGDRMPGSAYSGVNKSDSSLVCVDI